MLVKSLHFCIKQRIKCLLSDWQSDILLYKKVLKPFDKACLIHMYHFMLHMTQNQKYIFVVNYVIIVFRFKKIV